MKRPTSASARAEFPTRDPNVAPPSTPTCATPDEVAALLGVPADPDAGNTGSRIAYRALAASLRASLRRGDFSEGRRLPTEAQLTDATGLSRQTVRRALQELVAEGLIYRVRGRGTFSTSLSPGNRYLRSFGSIEDLLAYSVDSTMETIEGLRRTVDVDAAARLALTSDEVVAALVRRVHSGAPFCVTRVCFPIEIGKKLEADGLLATPGEVTSLTAIGVVDRVGAAPIAGAHQNVTGVAMPARLAPYIDVEAGEPTLLIERLYYDANGTPVELAISWFNASRYSYSVQLSRGAVGR